MKSLCLIAVFAFAALNAATYAVSIPEEILPENPHHGKLTFDIRSERLASGDVHFTVRISPASSIDHYSTDVGSVSISSHPDGTGTISNAGIRSVASERIGDVITCDFCVTPEELKNPDLSFRFNIPYAKPFAGFSSHFARLNKFLSP
jgi:hypothetical protein